MIFEIEYKNRLYTGFGTEFKDVGIFENANL